MSETTNGQTGTIVSIRIRSQDYPEIERIAKEIYGQGGIKAPSVSALTKKQFVTIFSI